MSVDGIPLGKHPQGFLIVTGLLVALTVGILAFFRGRRWI